MFGSKNIFVHPYFRYGLHLAPERDTRLPWCGMLADDPVKPVEHFLQFMRENTLPRTG
jgi:hypothetical protein